MIREDFRPETAQRIVVKVGTRLLTHQTGQLNLAYIERLVRELADLKNQGRQVILVSSGAIGAGMGRLGLKRRPETIPELQAAAAVGQGVLIQLYEKFFLEYGQVVAQVLLTRADFAARSRYLNASNTILTLLRWGVVPIINENDTVSVQEIKFGDNDRLSALVAGLCDADLLVILTTVEGLYEADPRLSERARLIREVKAITPELKRCAGGAGDELSTGGMVTKLQAAEIAVNSGAGMFIACGRDPGVLNRILRGENPGTYFYPRNRYLNRRKRWIAFGRNVQGSVTVDDGAKEALCKGGKSLLPVGVLSVEGSFERGALVSVLDRSGREIGRGLCNFSSEELSLIKKHPSSHITRLIGRESGDEVIHRDDLVICDANDLNWS
ncbi:MAG: glutamate 5-kinase [Firmicutes bacterium]|jgi:glutamate 5-kinase|nr:glutamate 5-kinase [Bacillota bacterium]